MANHANDIVTKGKNAGQLARPYINSSLVPQEIMASAAPEADEAPGLLRWNVPGAFRGSEGTWELVLEPATNTIMHFVFTSGPK